MKIPKFTFVTVVFSSLKLWEWRDQETKRFHIVSSNGQFKWDLPSELAFYANNQFKKYIPEKSLHEAICEVYPAPNNLNQVKKTDEFLKDLWKKKNKKQLLRYWWNSGKIQKRDLSVMGPFSKVWLKLENVKKSDALLLSLDEILSLAEENICLLGQTNNSILYHKKCNILLSVCSPKEAKNHYHEINITIITGCDSLIVILAILFTSNKSSRHSSCWKHKSLLSYFLVNWK